MPRPELLNMKKKAKVEVIQCLLDNSLPGDLIGWYRVEFLGERVSYSKYEFAANAVAARYKEKYGG